MQNSLFFKGRRFFGRPFALWLLLVATGAGGPVVYAQAHFNLWGEIREKFQFRDGYHQLKGPDDKGFVMNAQRLRLGMEFEKNDLGFVLTFEDSRIWGESSENRSEVGFGLSSAYFFVNFCDRFTFDIGRRPLHYDDGRYMNGTGWGDVTKAVDALMFKYRSLDGKTKADVGFSLSNNFGDIDFLTTYTVDWFKYYAWAWASREFGDRALVWTLLYAQDVNQRRLLVWQGVERPVPTAEADRLVNRYTVGTYFYLFQDKPLSATVYGYGQWGKNAYGQRLNAYLASAQLKYRPHPHWEIVAAYDFVSGSDYSQSDDADGRYSQAFDRFLGSRHGKLGYMDYFNVKGFDDLTQGAGLHQPYLRLYYRPHPKHRIELSGRYFALVHPYVKDKSGTAVAATPEGYARLPRSLGGEVDLHYRFDVFEDFWVRVGYSVMLPTATMEQLSGMAPGGSRFSQFAYVVLTYKPVLFNTERHAARKAAQAVQAIRAAQAVTSPF